MKNFDSDIVTALDAVQARAFWLVECQFDTTYYFTDCDIDLVYANNSYQSDQGLRVASIKQSSNFSIDKVTLEFGNVGLWFSSILLNEDVTNDTVIIRYIMYKTSVGVMAGGEADVAVLPEDGDVVVEDGDVVAEGGEFYSMIGSPPTLFNGYVTDWKLNEKLATITLSNEFMLWRKKTLRIPSASCPWSFKGAECAYAGAGTWCDKSVEQCKSLDNYDNFGGRKFVTWIEDQKFWWGDKGYGPG